MLKVSALVAALCFAGVAVQDGQDAKKKDKPAKKVEATCPMSGAPAKAEKFATFGGGKVYFCCDNCLGKFNTMKAKLNHQMVQTNQVKQVACPMSGRPVKDGQSVKVAGVNVGFCCGNCKGAAEKMETDAQILAFFNGKKFRTGFKNQRQLKAMKAKGKKKDKAADK